MDVCNWLLLPVHVNGPEMYDGLFQCCAVPLDPVLLQRIERLSGTAQQLQHDTVDHDVRELEVRDGWSRWYHKTPALGDLESDDEERPQTLQDDFDNYCPVVVTHDEMAALFCSDWHGERTELESMHIMPDGDHTEIQWSVYPKHCNVREESSTIEASLLYPEAVAQGSMPV